MYEYNIYIHIYIYIYIYIYTYRERDVRYACMRYVRVVYMPHYNVTVCQYLGSNTNIIV